MKAAVSKMIPFHRHTFVIHWQCDYVHITCGNICGVLNTFVSIFCHDNHHYLGISELEDRSACTHSIY